MLADLNDVIGRRLGPVILTGLVAFVLNVLAVLGVVSYRTGILAGCIWLVTGAVVVISAIVEVVLDRSE